VESIPLLGSVIPGSTIILAVSATAPGGTVSFWPLLFWSVLGAIIGDGASYWMGRRYQRRILATWPCNRYPQLAQRSEAFFEKHGGKSVAIGRFTPALRPFIPLFAGILDMPPRRFYIANVLSALLWAPAHIIPGIALGATLGLAAAVVGRLIGLVTIVLLALWLAAWLARYILRQALPRLAACQTALRRRASIRDNWLNRQILSLLDPERSELRGLISAGLVLIGATWLFLGVIEDVVTGDPLVRADRAVYALLQGLHSIIGDGVMTVITELGDSIVIIAIVSAATLWLMSQKAWRSALYLIVAVSGASLFNSGIKLILSRGRPIADLYQGISDYAFPSGHATVNSVLYGFLCVLVLRELRPLWRIPVAIIAASLVTLIALSRLYLGAHWFSDVVGGLAFGAIWVALLGTGYQLHRPDAIKPRGLIAVVVAALVLAGGINIERNFADDSARYAPITATRLMPRADWLAGAWQQLPVQRTDLIGEYQGPLTLQWAGSLDDFRERLTAQGWQPAPKLSLTTALTWIEPQPAPGALPALPLLQEGLAPRLTLIRVTSPTTRLVLRLWSSHVLIEADGATQKPLWIGSIVEEELRPLIWPLTISADKKDANAPRDHLGNQLGDQLAGLTAGSRLAQRSDIAGDGSADDLAAADYTWDGKVLLMWER
jgi:undecaprenyl-diphosphatase